ncbi:hypothetical protein I2I05_18885 [Hymenobacter sp. BT683]|uniref:Uncharacterized protein n=1 Tax=Hymenobacter jeongseonensis TaxID=2791027 RepID=A0ABS0IM95_9BACT|nr:hypothetical protein [Hymenobacter jeongseonensis]MBF9239466.1 hypothetical protein [Hymenobacter jeongseonensis]
MENLEKVIAWLEAGDAADYRAGVLLLQELTGHRSLVNTLLKKESAGHREKLTYELCKVGCEGRLADVGEVMNHFAQAVQGATAPSVNLVTSVTMPALLVEVEPAPQAVPEAVQGQVDELTQLMQRVYNQRCQLSNSLADLPEADGPRVVGEILSLQNQYNALSEKRRRLVAGEPTQVEPTAPVAPAAGEAAPVVDRAELLQKRGNLRSQVSKAKKAAAKTPDDQLKAEKVAKLQVELDTLELQIKQLPA